MSLKMVEKTVALRRLKLFEGLAEFVGHKFSMGGWMNLTEAAMLREELSCIGNTGSFCFWDIEDVPSIMIFR
mgnify:CR=1 FL=1